MTTIAELLPSVLDAVPQPVWVADSAGIVVYTNPAAVTALGYQDTADIQGRSSHLLLHPIRRDGSPFPASECLMLAPAQTGVTAHSDDDWFLRRDGSFFPVSWWSAPITLPSGRGVVCAWSDATERRAFEHAARERDAAQIRASESRAAQRRIIESVAAVHRQTARDLHDGAQQRLVNLLIGLRLAREQIATTSPQALPLIDNSVADAQAAIDELRQLAVGIHPSMLTARGLAPAVDALAARSPIPTVVSGRLDRRLPAAVESNVYFLISEAMTNAAKHSCASRIEITLTLADDLVVTVADDGIGGIDDRRSGSGLIGLTDRVAAFDGDITITSRRGGGTIIRARLPVPV
ncbi:PAS domain-containing protein [Micromonospora globbae]|uniref:histidine kinase n=1 Tax=Micromonospora globbae TaxID=1894969 RepID=A0ABZ1SBK2_9ACTN|nr:ATP-binding protein [Micromonospora globbae]